MFGCNAITRKVVKVFHGLTLVLILTKTIVAKIAGRLVLARRELTPTRSALVDIRLFAHVFGLSLVFNKDGVGLGVGIVDPQGRLFHVLKVSEPSGVFGHGITNPHERATIKLRSPRKNERII